MKLDTILKESFGATDTELNDDMRIMNYPDWDSMSFMFFITKLEETYGIEFTGDEIADMETVGRIKAIIVSKGKEL